MVKRGYIRTLEAVIAIILILFATYTLTPRDIINPRETPYVIESAQDYVITEVMNNKDLREQIINYDIGSDEAERQASILAANSSLQEIVTNRLPPGYEFSTAICTTPTCVSLPSLATSVYTKDVIIAGETSQGKPVLRLVRVWFWRTS